MADELKGASAHMRILMKFKIHSHLFRGTLGVALLFLAATAGVKFVEGLPDAPQSGRVASADEAVIARAIAEASSRIQKLAAMDPDAFAAILRQAFGARLDANAERDLVQRAAQRQLPLPGRILFVPSEVLAGAAGAYASENRGTIFLDQ